MAHLQNNAQRRVERAQPPSHATSTGSRPLTGPRRHQTGLPAAALAAANIVTAHKRLGPRSRLLLSRRRTSPLSAPQPVSRPAARPVSPRRTPSTNGKTPAQPWHMPRARRPGGAHRALLIWRRIDAHAAKCDTWPAITPSHIDPAPPQIPCAGEDPPPRPGGEAPVSRARASYISVKSK